MNACARPPALDDAKLLSALDGEAETETLAHLSACRSCRQRLDVLAAQDRGLRAALDEVSCPPHATLADWSVAALAAPAAERVAAHVAACAVCRAELDDLAAFEAEALAIQAAMDRDLAAFRRAPEPREAEAPRAAGPLAGLRRVLASVQASGPLPASLRARGKAGPATRSYSADAGRIIVSCVIRSETEPERFRLSGRVHGIAVTRVRLDRPSGARLAEIELDAHGSFQVPDLPAGALCLRFEGPGLVLELDPPLEIGPVG